MLKRTVMVRVLIETERSDEDLALHLKDAALSMAIQPDGRVWIAIDHPTEEGAKRLWDAIEKGNDPQKKGAPA